MLDISSYNDAKYTLIISLRRIHVNIMNKNEIKKFIQISSVVCLDYHIHNKDDFLCINICWAPKKVLKPEQKGKGFNTSRGAQQILMLFDRYYCIKTFSRSKTLEKCLEKVFFVYSTLAMKGTLPANVLKTPLRGQRLTSC